MDPRPIWRLRGSLVSWAAARRTSQLGQSMVLVALLLIAFIALLAVTLDGGYAYLQRRNAQTAADAGALAGARELCVSGDVALATQAAIDYALVRNRALEADVTISGGEVQVNTRILFATFFGNALGRPSITAAAVAAANCFAPGQGEGMLPLAWNCPPASILTDGEGDEYCDMQIDDGVDPPELYIIMNSRKVGEDDAPFCLSEGGTVDCDPDGDGYEELLVGGDRSWLDLSGGGGGAAELIDWIRNGFPGGISIHTWYAGQQGVANNIFIEIGKRLDQPVLLPVYNAINNGLPPYPYDDPDDNTVTTVGTWTDYFHVISFSLFVPTCVHATGADTGCTLYNTFSSAGALGPNDKTIEGYFVNGSVVGLGGRGDLDAGAFTLYLTR